MNKKKNNVFFEKAQRFGKSFMLPIAVLPAAGLLLGIGGAFSNAATIEAYPFLDVAFLQAIFTIMSTAGNIIFANLPVIFAVGIAIGLARSDKGTAGLAAMLGFLVMHATINAMLVITGKLAEENIAEVGQGMVLGIQSLETGVFGGVVLGLLAYYLHNRYNKIELPRFLGFFGGSRFIPIATSFASIFLGIILFYAWPVVQSGIFSLGGLVEATGYIGTLIYGFVLRLLGPFGLHHIFYLPFWTTSLGGSMIVDGSLVEGTQRIFFAQLGSTEPVNQFFIGTARFMSGRHITMMFGLLGAALAIYHTAKPQHKKKVLGLMLSAGLTSFLTGITEPLEFSFLFVAPILYVIHSFFDGLAFMFAHIFEITIGQTFSGGFIDFVLFGVLQGVEKTNWIWVPIIGIPWFFLYYFTFKYLIRKFNFKTPGREEEMESYSFTKTERASAIITGLGGESNIKDVDNCATRLRVTVNQADLVNKDDLKKTGAHGVVASGNGVQVIYGPEVTGIKNEVEEALGED
ncbi:PTS transporter subunit EIIC [Gracilibacillus sp. D59]|uniref:PTS transporter subunit EIIC n=1 Tax=Gracilibacillus sp. D59 TaxID=3457434 RepID=UPI003FCE6C0F